MFWKRSAHADHVAGIEHINSLFSYSLVLTGVPRSAEDLVQQTYSHAIQTWTHRSDVSIKVWMLALLRNLWLSEPRYATPPALGTREEERTASRQAPDVYSFPSRTETEQVRDAIHRLPVEFREVILLREFEELSDQEIASIVCCETEVVISRLAIARSKLCTFLSSTLQGILGEHPQPRNESA